MFSQWGIPETSGTQMGWNLSGEPCSGTAVEQVDFESPSFNPALKCDCNFPNSTCHITQIKVIGMNAAGPIPEGLWTLTYLINLNLNQNYLTGSLSPSIGNLTRMQWMTFGANALSGPVPAELGRLTDLRSLAFDTNNFSGSLPPELGNLRRLQQLYIDSSGVGGKIPSTFANLQNLVTVRASDNEFTGRIPDFIGNWTLLESLRISGLSNGTLDFIKDLKSLRVLVLRNNRISGTIPTDIGEYQNLTQLDLSFNNLSGEIPRDLFNLSRLSFLFLGNNSLYGTLPAVKSATLRNLDFSYNELSGTLPSWVNEPNLQINLVVNNFTLGDSGNSGLPSGLNCLQRNFPCGHGSPIYSSFAINCGGSEITSSSQIVYDQENETLGAATYYVTSERRWGVSNAGQRENPAYTASLARQFNSLDSALFQTARISAGSLRYYGLGLENGNYTVNLQFAELQIEDGPTWRSLGRRVFDIYIQVC
ncbi:putative non-specific serine/threonine protein kinase [Helianthus annuus]|nr:putative non-specific serine/threonine protein kinase [Helianthus annuus]KAJ0684934.1 putative non-specific serine/threonine protein kinase [Helianthus annuus]KAJ0688860.1 putative non-specific serine/threonine protein kinase [Helianthus annuus]